MKKVPDYKGSSFNPEWLTNKNIEPSKGRAELHEHYAGLWNNVSSSPVPGFLFKDSEPCIIDVLNQCAFAHLCKELLAARVFLPMTSVKQSSANS